MGGLRNSPTYIYRRSSSYIFRITIPVDMVLIQKNIDWYARLKTAGHKGNVDDMRDLYFSGHPANQLYDDVISKVDWEEQIDLSHFKEIKFMFK